MEIAILNFGCRTTVRLNTAIEKTFEKCTEFYKGIRVVHNQCLDSNRHPKSSFLGQGRTSTEFTREDAKGRGEPSKTRSC